MTDEETGFLDLTTKVWQMYLEAGYARSSIAILKNILSVPNFSLAYNRVHAYKVHAHEVHVRDMHAHEVHACKMHVYEVHTHEMHACEDTPMRYTPMRYTPMKYMPEVHAL
jgi:hypothetical protein